ncbi:peptide deformylase [Helicobacter felis]|uniref:peptide deformylase n=1 Tax=Helicobacter felis TaxID=214 RepID=UPI000CED8CAC|nr:peptide deformylase [Helicobacter felis]
MAILEVLQYPHKKLRTRSSEVRVFDAQLHAFLEDMHETMLARKGIGLAAIQVGVPKRILIINLPREEDETQHPEDRLEIINPVITHTEGSILWREGCLSVPEFYEEIERHANLTLAYQDRHGESKMLQASELLSVAIQHEMDHLNGILFVDKLSMLRRKKFEKEFKKALKSED